MAKFYCNQIGYGVRGGNGSESQPFNGLWDLHNRGLALMAAGDTVVFNRDRWWNMCDELDGGYSKWAGGETTNIASNDFWGPFLGSNQVSTSTASGKIFDWRGCTFDGRNSDKDSTYRVYHALRIQGESFRVLAEGFKIYNPNRNYLFNDTTGATRVPWRAQLGTGNATLSEQASFENVGLVLAGLGYTIDGLTMHGAPDFYRQGWSRHGLICYVSNAGMANATPGLTIEVRNCHIAGSLTGITVGAFGIGGLLVPAGTKVKVYNNRLQDPVWGWAIGSRKDEFNAGQHGNAIEFLLQARNLAECYGNTVNGNWQDGIDVAGAGHVIVKYNKISGIGDPFIWQWQWNATTSTWFLVYRASTEGNGIKMGLGIEGTGSQAPTTWYGSDGVSGSDNLFAMEQYNQCFGNQIDGCNASGITSNTGRGCLIHANEILNCRGGGLNLFGRTPDSATNTPGNHVVTHNYIELASNSNASAAALRADTRQRFIILNNIFNGGSNTAAYDIFWAAGNPATALRKTNNMLVTGRVTGPVPADTVAITSPGSITWVKGFGEAVKRLQGDPGIVRYLKTLEQCHLDMYGRPYNSATPELGPFASDWARPAR